MTPYLALDIETTGLDPATCQVLEVACVAETGDWTTPPHELPSMRFLVNHLRVTGEPFALAMNRDLIAELACPEAERGAVWEHEVSTVLRAFIVKHLATNWPPDVRRTVTVAGKNVAGFDLKFLERLPHWGTVGRLLRHRVIDTGNLWWDPEADEKIPDTAECLRRAGLNPEPTHRALEDCLDTVRLVRSWHVRRQSCIAA